MKYFYHFGKKTMNHVTVSVRPLFQRLNICERENIEDVVDKIKEMDSKNTPLGRDCLHTEYNIIQPMREFITIYSVGDTGDVVLGVVTFYIHHRDICMETLCSPFIPEAKGVGVELVRIVKRFMRLMKLDKIFVASLRTSTKFYEKNGFLIDEGNFCESFTDYPYVDMVYKPLKNYTFAHSKRPHRG